MVSFADLSQRVHLINDLILSDMICVLDANECAAEATIFSKHVLRTKHWFGRISYPNKKRYLLSLLHDVRSAWTLSLLLKSMWNCRPKDAIMSVSEPHGWLSSYDQAPMDHNRTAIPVSMLKVTMKSDRVWFLSLEPEAQALLLSELLTVAGGPAMWEVLRLAQTLFESYSTKLTKNIQDCVPVHETKGTEGAQNKAAMKSKSLLESPGPRSQQPQQAQEPQQPQQPQTQQPITQGQKDLDANLATWNATIKSLRDSLKLEELEVIFNDGTTRKIWKVNRPKPDGLETLDFLQLLPSSIGKHILSYLPQTSFADCARVNKYWAYLIEEYRAEVSIRTKIDAEKVRLNEIIMKHDTSFEDIGVTTDLLPATDDDHGGMTSTGIAPHTVLKTATSVRASEKSGGGYSLRYFSDKLAKPAVTQKPIRNMKELNERLEIRGAIDENIWKWCANITAQHRRVGFRFEKKGKVKYLKKKSEIEKEIKIKEIEDARKPDKNGIIDTISFENLHFPCPLMKKNVILPLQPPLYKDPAKTTSLIKMNKRMSDSWTPVIPKQNAKRYNLWTRDVSPLYPVFKVPSHQFPN